MPERLALDRRSAPLAQSVFHFFVGKPGLARRTPVDRHDAFVGQPLFEQLQKYPLRPFVILRVGGIDFAVPVVAEPDRIDLPPEIGDRLFGGYPRMYAGFDGVIFGRQAERVPAHGVHVELKEPGGDAVVAALEAGRGPGLARAVVSSFDPEALREVADRQPAWPRWLNVAWLDAEVVTFAVELGATGVAADWRAITPTWARRDP